MDTAANRRRCSELRKDGEPCRGRPVTDGTACPAHGGRLREDPARNPEATAARLLAAVNAPKGTTNAFLAAAGAWETNPISESDPMQPSPRGGPHATVPRNP